MDFLFSKVPGIDGYFKSIFPNIQQLLTHLSITAASKECNGQRRFSKLSNYSITLVLISITQYFHLFLNSFMIKINRARHI